MIICFLSSFSRHAPSIAPSIFKAEQQKATKGRKADQKKEGGALKRGDSGSLLKRSSDSDIALREKHNREEEEEEERLRELEKTLRAKKAEEKKKNRMAASQKWVY